MKLVSWNIQQGAGPRVEAIGDQLEKWNTDVVGLMEFRDTQASWINASKMAQLGLKNQVTTIDAPGRRICVLLLVSRFPFEV